MFMEEQEREQLIVERMSQVKYIAQRISAKLPLHILLEDLISAGVLGLIDAIEKFDPARGVKFKTYADLRIRGAILDSLRNLDWAPHSLRKNIKDLEKASLEFKGEHGRAPTNDELADKMGISCEELAEILNETVLLNVESLDSFKDEETRENGKKWNNEVKPPIDLEDVNNPFLHCQESELKNLFLNEISRLPLKEQKVILAYYYQELTMKTIGSLMSVNESRISQLHTKAINHLRRGTSYLNGGPMPLKKRLSVKVNFEFVTEDDLAPIVIIPGKEELTKMTQFQKEIISPTVGNLFETLEQLKPKNNPRSVREAGILEQALLICSYHSH